MRRKGVVQRIGDKFVHIRLAGGGLVALKKSAYPSLKEDIHVVVTLHVTKAKVQPPVPPRALERRRRIRWALREYMRLRAAGEDPDLWALLRRGHLQPVETN